MTLENITHLAAISGGMLYVLAFVLLVGLTVIVDRTWSLSRIAAKGTVLAQALGALPRLDHDGLRKLVSGMGDTPQKALLEAPLQHPEVRDRIQLSELLEETILVQAPRIDKRLWLLDTIVTLGPLLGLLGTIIGIFEAFKVLANPEAAPAQVTGGVAEALVATAVGLLIAIIGLVFFNGLQNRVRFIVHQMETLKLMLVNRLGVRSSTGIDGDVR